MVVAEYGDEAAAELSVMSMDTIQYFVEMVPEMASPYDALWIILAVITAWRIPKGSGIDLPQSQSPITPA